MAEKISHVVPISGKPVDDNTESDSGMESATPNNFFFTNPRHYQDGR
jgi:hypothetical protein